MMKESNAGYASSVCSLLHTFHVLQCREGAACLILSSIIDILHIPALKIPQAALLLLQDQVSSFDLENHHLALTGLRTSAAAELHLTRKHLQADFQIDYRFILIRKSEIWNICHQTSATKTQREPKETKTWSLCVRPSLSVSTGPIAVFSQYSWLPW